MIKVFLFCLERSQKKKVDALRKQIVSQKSPKCAGQVSRKVGGVIDRKVEVICPRTQTLVSGKAPFSLRFRPLACEKAARDVWANQIPPPTGLPCARRCA